MEDGRLAADAPCVLEHIRETRRHAPRETAVLLGAALRQLADHILVRFGNLADVNQKTLAFFRQIPVLLRVFERGERVGDERPRQPPRAVPSVVRDIERPEPLRRGSIFRLLKFV